MTRFRNTHPAFNGSFRLGDGESHELRLGWEAEGASIDAVIDFDQKSFLLTLVSKGVEDRISDWDGF
jgi:hypothetical protein